MLYTESGLAVSVVVAQVEEAAGAGLTFDERDIRPRVERRQLVASYGVNPAAGIRQDTGIRAVCAGRVRVGQRNQVEDILATTGAACGKGRQEKRDCQ